MAKAGRVALVSGSAGPNDATTYTTNLAKGLMASGVAVRVVAAGGALERRASAEGLDITVLPLLGKPLLGELAFARAAAALRDFGARVLHAQELSAWRLTRRLARRLGVPAVVTVQEFVARAKDLPWPEAGAPVSIVLSQALRENLVNLGGVAKGRVVVTPPGIDVPAGTPGALQPTRVANAAARARPAENAGADAAARAPRTLIVGTMSPLVEAKGIEHFVGAARLVLDSKRDVEFVVCGSGPRERGLRRLARSLDVRKRLTFLGAELGPGEILPNLDVFVLAGLKEATALSALEAMAYARPVVAFGTGGVFAVVRDGTTGVLVELHDERERAERSLAEALARLYDDPELASDMGRAGREVAEREFALDRMVEATEEVYSRVLEDGTA